MDLLMRRLIIPAALVAGAFLLGLACERILSGRLRKIAAKTKWARDEIIVKALRGVAVLWFTIAGLYGAILVLSLSPEFLRIMLKALTVVVIASTTVFAGRVASGLVCAYTGRQEGILGSASILVNIAKAVVYLLGALIILQFMGVSIAPILTALGVGGLAVALALQDTLSNLFSGIHIVASRQIRPGDYLRLDSGEEGYVTDISWRHTTIRVLQNNRIIIPNVKLASAITTNYSLPDKELAVLIRVNAGYGGDLERVEKVTLEVAREVMREVPGAAPGFDPVIRYGAFDDSGVALTAVLRAAEFVDQFLLKHEFIKRLHARYRQEGIEIPFPTRTVFVKGDDGDAQAT